MATEKQHEIQAAAELTAKEVNPRGAEMKQLSDLVWHGNPPYSEHVSKSESEQMFEALMNTPAGQLTLVQRFGQHKVDEVKQDLVRQGKLPGGAMNPEV